MKLTTTGWCHHPHRWSSTSEYGPFAGKSVLAQQVELGVVILTLLIEDKLFLSFRP